MKSGDFEKFIENVKMKTKLTTWITQIKATPKDPTIYLVLSDFLEEENIGSRNPELPPKVGVFLRKQVNSQTHGVPADDMPLGLEIAEDFRNIGIGPKKDNAYSQFVPVPRKLTSNHPEYSNRTLMRALMNSGENLKAMAATLPQISDRPHVYAPNPDSSVYKKPQANNVAFQDIDDVDVQLFSIFLIAQRIGTEQLVLLGNEKDQCKEWTPALSPYFMNNWVENGWADEDQTETVRVVRDYRQIIPYLRQSWTCCDKFTDDSISELEMQIQNLDVDDHLDMAFVDNWAARQIVSRWLNAIASWRLEGCRGYRSRVSAIIKDFRDPAKVRIAHSSNT